jgi:hypothetical protein
MAEPLVRSVKRLVQGLSLRECTGEAIQDPGLGGVGAVDPGCDHRDHDVVRDQLAGVHVLRGLAPQLAALSDLLTEHVTGGDVQDLAAGRQLLGLGALAGTGRAEEHCSGHKCR